MGQFRHLISVDFVETLFSLCLFFSLFFLEKMIAKPGYVFAIGILALIMTVIADSDMAETEDTDLSELEEMDKSDTDDEKLDVSKIMKKLLANRQDEGEERQKGASWQIKSSGGYSGGFGGKQAEGGMGGQEA